MKVAILDDYQGCAREFADWNSLPAGTQLAVVREHLSGPALVEALRECEVIVAMRERTPFPADLLAALPGLRLLVTTGPRNAAIDMRACEQRGVTVCATGSRPHAAAELTWALILAVVKNVVQEDVATRSGKWQTAIPADLASRTLGVVGVGKLGTQVARVGQAFGMEVIGWSPNLTDERAAASGVRRVDKQTLFAESDIVSLHLVLGPSTRGIVGRPEIAAMRPDACFVNTSRGGLLDHAALYEALHAGRIAGAALDVFPEEPLNPDDPVFRVPRLVLTPHIGYVTRANYQRYFQDALEDILQWLAGSPVRVITAQ